MNAMQPNSDPVPHCLTDTVIILLYRKGDQGQVENYRPFVLVNVLVKIVSTVFCNRIKPVLPGIIQLSGTGSVLGCRIRESMIMTDDIMYWCRNHQPDASLIRLDFAKVYDRIQ